MMAMYQLCRAKAAKHPFYIESIDINIYTIEELTLYQNCGIVRMRRAESAPPTHELQA